VNTREVCFVIKPTNVKPAVIDLVVNREIDPLKFCTAANGRAVDFENAPENDIEAVNAWK